MVSNIFYFHPYLGKWSKIWLIFLRWVETTNQNAIESGFNACNWARVVGLYPVDEVRYQWMRQAHLLGVACEVLYITRVLQLVWLKQIIISKRYHFNRMFSINRGFDSREMSFRKSAKIDNLESMNQLRYCGETIWDVMNQLYKKPLRL